MKVLLIISTLLVCIQTFAQANLEMTVLNDQAALDEIWQSLPARSVRKHPWRDKFVSYYWGHELDFNHGIQTSKVFILFPQKFKDEFGYGADFATALLVKVNDQVVVLDKIRGDSPMTLGQWRAIVLKEANERLETTRLSLVRDLKSKQKSLRNVSRYGGWLWGQSREQLQQDIDNIYDQLNELGVNEYAEANISCRQFTNAEQLESPLPGQWCFEIKTHSKVFDLADIVKLLNPVDSHSEQWNDRKLYISRSVGFY